MKVLIPISGGKDSQACLKLAVEEFGANNAQGLFCDTKFEHPVTYEHMEKLRTLYGDITIHTVNDGSVLEESIRFGRFPGGGARHCTDKLKIRQTRIFLKELSERIGGFEVWYGMRWGESSARAKRYEDKISTDLYHPHEIMPSKYPKYLGKMGVRFRLPIIDWDDAQVYELLGDEINPLYKEGFDRVGCFPCLAAGDAYKEKAFNHDDFGRDQYKKVMIVSEQIGKNIFTSKRGRERNAGGLGCSVCEFT